MARLILLNDVQCEINEGDLIAGPLDSPITKEGVLQCEQVATHLSEKFPKIDMITASESNRITKLLHRIRMKCDIKQPRIKYSPFLNERNFGVLNGTKYIFGLSSDMFRHTRICAEGGESVSQCFDRAMNYLKSVLVTPNIKSVLCVTHPFICQVLCNHICNKRMTILTEFWWHKGSFMVARSGAGLKPISFHHSHVVDNEMLQHLAHPTMKEVYKDEIT